MSVDAYIPEPQGLISVNTIGGVTPATPLTANPGDQIEKLTSRTEDQKRQLIRSLRYLYLLLLCTA
jgi:hypothetical protein